MACSLLFKILILSFLVNSIRLAPVKECSMNLPDNICQNIRQIDLVIMIDYIQILDNLGQFRVSDADLADFYNWIEKHLKQLVASFSFKYGRDDVCVAVIRIDDDQGNILSRGTARIAQRLNDFEKNIFNAIKQPYGRLPNNSHSHSSFVDCMNILRDEILLEKNGDRPDAQNMVISNHVYCS